MTTIIHFLLLVVVLPLTCTVPSGQHYVQAPAYRDGDFWEFRALRLVRVREAGESEFKSSDLGAAYQVLFLKGEFRVFRLERAHDLRERLARALQDLQEGNVLGDLLLPVQGKEITGEEKPAYLSMFAVDQEPPNPLNFPLFVGKKWSDRSAFHIMGVDSMWLNNEYHVSGFSDVTTEAGTFPAFKIDGVGRGVGRTGKFKWVYTYYYSPDAKCIVKESSYLESPANPRADGPTQERQLTKYGSAF